MAFNNSSSPDVKDEPDDVTSSVPTRKNVSPSDMKKFINEFVTPKPTKRNYGDKAPHTVASTKAKTNGGAWFSSLTEAVSLDTPKSKPSKQKSMSNLFRRNSNNANQRVPLQRQRSIRNMFGQALDGGFGKRQSVSEMIDQALSTHLVGDDVEKTPSQRDKNVRKVFDQALADAMLKHQSVSMMIDQTLNDDFAGLDGVVVSPTGRGRENRLSRETDVYSPLNRGASLQRQSPRKSIRDRSRSRRPVRNSSIRNFARSKSNESERIPTSPTELKSRKSIKPGSPKKGVHRTYERSSDIPGETLRDSIHNNAAHHRRTSTRNVAKTRSSDNPLNDFSPRVSRRTRSGDDLVDDDDLRGSTFRAGLEKRRSRKSMKFDGSNDVINDFSPRASRRTRSADDPLGDLHSSNFRADLKKGRSSRRNINTPDCPSRVSRTRSGDDMRDEFLVSNNRGDTKMRCSSRRIDGGSDDIDKDFSPRDCLPRSSQDKCDEVQGSSFRAGLKKRSSSRRSMKADCIEKVYGKKSRQSSERFDKDQSSRNFRQKSNPDHEVSTHDAPDKAKSGKRSSRQKDSDPDRSLRRSQHGDHRRHQSDRFDQRGRQTNRCDIKSPSSHDGDEHPAEVLISPKRGKRSDSPSPLKKSDRSHSSRKTSDRSSSSRGISDRSASTRRISDRSPSIRRNRDHPVSTRRISDRSPSICRNRDHSVSNHRNSEHSVSHRRNSDLSVSNRRNSDHSSSNRRHSNQSVSNRRDSDHSAAANTKNRDNDHTLSSHRSSEHSGLSDKSWAARSRKVQDSKDDGEGDNATSTHSFFNTSDSSLIASDHHVPAVRGLDHSIPDICDHNNALSSSISRIPVTSALICGGSDDLEPSRNNEDNNCELAHHLETETSTPEGGQDLICGNSIMKEKAGQKFCKKSGDPEHDEANLRKNYAEFECSVSSSNTWNIDRSELFASKIHVDSQQLCNRNLNRLSFGKTVGLRRCTSDLSDNRCISSLDIDCDNENTVGISKRSTSANEVKLSGWVDKRPTLNRVAPDLKSKTTHHTFGSEMEFNDDDTDFFAAEKDLIVNYQTSFNTFDCSTFGYDNAPQGRSTYPTRSCDDEDYDSHLDTSKKECKNSDTSCTTNSTASESRCSSKEASYDAGSNSTPRLSVRRLSNHSGHRGQDTRLALLESTPMHNAGEKTAAQKSKHLDRLQSKFRSSAMSTSSLGSQKGRQNSFSSIRDLSNLRCGSPVGRQRSFSELMCFDEVSRTRSFSEFNLSSKNRSLSDSFCQSEKDEWFVFESTDNELGEITKRKQDGCAVDYSSTTAVTTRNASPQKKREANDEITKSKRDQSLSDYLSSPDKAKTRPPSTRLTGIDLLAKPSGFGKLIAEDEKAKMMESPWMRRRCKSAVGQQ